MVNRYFYLFIGFLCLLLVVLIGGLYILGHRTESPLAPDPTMPTSTVSATSSSGGVCQNRCGDRICQELVCLGSGCPCAETIAGCPVDCGQAPTVSPSSVGYLEGRVTIGPICPVELKDMPCPVPPELYAAQDILVFRADDRTIASSTRPDTTGFFRFRLPAGTYVIETRRSALGGEGTYETVTVSSGRVTTIAIDIDTGIR